MFVLGGGCGLDVGECVAGPTVGLEVGGGLASKADLRCRWKMQSVVVARARGLRMGWEAGAAFRGTVGGSRRHGCGSGGGGGAGWQGRGRGGRGRERRGRHRRRGTRGFGRRSLHVAQPERESAREHVNGEDTATHPAAVAAFCNFWRERAPPTCSTSSFCGRGQRQSSTAPLHLPRPRARAG